MASSEIHQNYVDIETLPSNNPLVMDDITAGVKPPKNYKKPDTIAEWERDEKPALVAEALSRTALDGTYGRVCVVGWAFEDYPVDVFAERDECATLRAFFAAVRDAEEAHPPRDV